MVCGNTIMAGMIKFKQTVFFPDAGPDVMDHIGGPFPVFSVAYNHNVRKIGRNNAGYKVPGPVIVCIVRDRQ